MAPSFSVFVHMISVTHGQLLPETLSGELVSCREEYAEVTVLPRV